MSIPLNSGHGCRVTAVVFYLVIFATSDVLSVDYFSESPSAEIVEGSSVTLTCSSDANPAANYTWYKKNGDADLYPLSKEPQLVFSSIQSSDSGEYYCTAENKLWGKMSKYIYINVTYAPRLPSVSVSPSAEIVEGSSVTLTCSSDANPAAKYTWYKKLPSVSVSPSAEIVEGSSVTLTCSSDANPAAKYTWYKEEQKLLQSPEGSYYLTSISSEDGGNYSCKAQNQHGQTSSSVFIDVQYAPKLPSVSVSPSAEIVEGSSVTLTCSSDANPAANYTWYKENEDSPKALGQIFTITDFRAEHSGNYSCEAQNRRGRNKTTVHLTVVTGQT
ncbi:B-cell receptor CD22-like, partial [Sparus aurata]|uniref:B-cell receptor CD22-like n=1 Tax=Sparus aurata TaxID=8175 RepID=UPI0011C163BC